MTDKTNATSHDAFDIRDRWIDAQCGANSITSGDIELMAADDSKPRNKDVEYAAFRSYYEFAYGKGVANTDGSVLMTDSLTDMFVTMGKHGWKPVAVV